MDKKFNGTTVETNGIRSIAGGGTGSTTAAAALTALGAVPTAEKGAANGVATLDANQKLTSSQIPDLTITDFLGACANETEMLAKPGQKGDWVTRSDDGKVYVITGNTPSQASSWTALSYPASTSLSLTNNAPENLAATAAAGDSTEAARADHVHARPTPADIGALPDAIVVSGAGTAEVNGTYIRGQNLNSSPAWYKGQSNISFNGSDQKWRITTPVFDPGSGQSFPSPVYETSSIGVTTSTSPLGFTFNAMGAGTIPPPFLRAAHTHAIADTTGLQTALDGKASTSHKSTHAIGGSDALTPADIGAAPALERRTHVFYSSGTYTLLAGRNVDLRTRVSQIGATGTITLPRRDLIDLAQDSDDLVIWVSEMADGGSLRIERYIFTGSSYLNSKQTVVTTTTTGLWRFRLIGGDWALQPVNTHTHAIADTTGLQTALDGKASTTHKSTHAIGGSDALTPADIGAAEQGLEGQGKVYQSSEAFYLFDATQGAASAVIDDGVFQILSKFGKTVSINPNGLSVDRTYNLPDAQGNFVVGGGVAKIERVASMPVTPDPDTLYIVIP